MAGLGWADRRRVCDFDRFSLRLVVGTRGLRTDSPRPTCIAPDGKACLPRTSHGDRDRDLRLLPHMGRLAWSEHLTGTEPTTYVYCPRWEDLPAPNTSRGQRQRPRSTAISPMGKLAWSEHLTGTEPTIYAYRHRGAKSPNGQGNRSYVGECEELRLRTISTAAEATTPSMGGKSLAQRTRTLSTGKDARTRSAMRAVTASRRLNGRSRMVPTTTS
jgi:hypothetical protein